MRPVKHLAQMFEAKGRGCATVDATVDPRARHSIVSQETAERLGFRGSYGKVMLKLPASGCGYSDLPVKVGKTGGAPMIIGRDYLDAVGAEVTGRSVSCCRCK